MKRIVSCTSTSRDNKGCMIGCSSSLMVAPRSQFLSIPPLWPPWGHFPSKPGSSHGLKLTTIGTWGYEVPLQFWWNIEGLCLAILIKKSWDQPWLHRSHDHPMLRFHPNQGGARGGLSLFWKKRCGLHGDRWLSNWNLGTIKKGEVGNALGGQSSVHHEQEAMTSEFWDTICPGSTPALGILIR